MYAVGVLLYEIICGRPPFVGDDPTDTLRKHLSEPPPVPSRQFGVPKPLAELMVRLISKTPTGRPQSWRDLVDAIQRCQKQVLLTTGLRKVVSVDEFDLADSGDETSGGAWLNQAREGAERTGTWSKENIGKSLGEEFQLGGDTFASQDQDGGDPFGG
jgi:serine/threonine-protein kinase